MAYMVVPTGREPDTCETPCQHRDCAAHRRLLADACPLCGATFQPGDKVTRSGDADADPLAHLVCVDERAQKDRAPEAPPFLTITGTGDFLCSCGNRPWLDGFYPAVIEAALGEAREVEPKLGGPWDAETYACAKCGAAYTVTATDRPTVVAGTRWLFVALDVRS